MFVCSNCSFESIRWEGRCSNCLEWGSLVELSSVVVSPSSGGRDGRVSLLSSIDSGSSLPLGSGIPEFDRVIGGGFFLGQVVMLSGEPGVGKSTLASQLAIQSAKKGEVLYVAGEESAAQVKGRFERLVDKSLKGNSFFSNISIFTGSSIDSLAKVVTGSSFSLIVLDSLHSLGLSTVTGSPGSLSQVRAVGAYIVSLAKEFSIPVLIVGQVNKGGVLAGPKVVEHMVDTVLVFSVAEGFRLLSSSKNRYGSTSEIGLFRMDSLGMVPVLDPVGTFLESGDSLGRSAISAFVAGKRVVLVEVQALVVPRRGEVGVKRVANGFKRQKLEMLCAIISKFTEISLNDCDVFVSILGGIEVKSSDIDMAICAAIVASVDQGVVLSGAVFIGEVGLTGYIKAVKDMDHVYKGCKRFGFKLIYCNDSDRSVKKLSFIGDLSGLLRSK